MISMHLMKEWVVQPKVREEVTEYGNDVHFTPRFGKTVVGRLQDGLRSRRYISQCTHQYVS